MTFYVCFLFVFEEHYIDSDSCDKPGEFAALDSNIQKLTIFSSLRTHESESNQLRVQVTNLARLNSKLFDRVSSDLAHLSQSRV